MSYYKTIEGKKMDAAILDQASLLVQGKGDGRLSLDDAKILLKLMTDGNVITDVEKDTVDYVFKTFRLTDSATEWFKKEMVIWQSHKTPKRVALSDLSDKHFAQVDVLHDSAAKKARQHALEAATNETSADHDEIGLWVRLSDGTTVEVFSNFIELEDDFVQLRGGCMVPVKAIEKVEI